MNCERGFVMNGRWFPPRKWDFRGGPGIVGRLIEEAMLFFSWQPSKKGESKASSYNLSHIEAFVR
jgi:hypothetical protein